MAGQDGERAPTSSPARWALSKALEATCADSELAQRCIATALRAANLPAVPDEIESLLAFARLSLEPVLAEELGPRTAHAIMQDLEAEIVRVRRSTVRMARVALKRIATPASPVTVPPTPVPTVHSPAPRDSLPAGRPVVAIVDHDRWARASLARALLQAGCDVLPLDGPTELRELFADAEETHVDAVVIDHTGSGAAEAIAALLCVLPAAKVLPRDTGSEAIVSLLGVTRR